MTEAWPLLGRKLRLAVLGGGPGSFIGPIHRAAARHHGTALPCRSCLPRDIRKAAAMQPYLAAWRRSASSSNDRFLCAADLPTDDVSTEDVVSATEDDEDEDDGHC